MKYKYIIICLFVLLFCSGCSVTYNLNIDSKINFEELVSIDAITSTDIDSISEYNQFMPIDYYADDSSVFNTKKDDVEYYDITKSEDNSKIEFSYTFDIDKFKNSMMARSCYEYVTVMNSYNKDNLRDELLISTSKKFLCFNNYNNLDDVTVNITTKKEVYSNNADSVNGNTYTWYINKDTKDDASIQMVINSEVIDEGIPFWEENLLFIIVCIVLIFSGIVYLFIKRRSDKVNKI